MAVYEPSIFENIEKSVRVERVCKGNGTGSENDRKVPEEAVYDPLTVTRREGEGGK